MIVNDLGSCPGTRGGGREGLTACEGTAPAAETCDGRDGLTDNLAPDAPCAIASDWSTCPGTRSGPFPGRPAHILWIDLSLFNRGVHRARCAIARGLGKGASRG